MASSIRIGTLYLLHLQGSGLCQQLEVCSCRGSAPNQVSDLKAGHFISLSFNFLICKIVAFVRKNHKCEVSGDVWHSLL